MRGQAVDRVNRGRLGPKDLFGWQANASDDRLTRPWSSGTGPWWRPTTEPPWTSWRPAFRELLDRHGPGSIRFYTSGRLFLGGVLHPRRARPRRHRHLAPGRQHPALHGHRRRGVEESFGCDGQPGSYDDIDHADVIALYGHNLAETQPVQWMRILDRLEGADPPRIICMDPRPAPVALRADVHLAPRLGTNVALLERAPPRGHPPRPRRPRLHRGAHRRLRRTGRARCRLHPGLGVRHLRHPHRAHSPPPRKSSALPKQCCPRCSKASTSRTRPRRRRCRSTTCT
ncbi:molybdopterin-dependent oxidoreductase [Yinghuangia aomiensis]